MESLLYVMSELVGILRFNNEKELAFVFYRLYYNVSPILVNVDGKQII